MAELSFQQITNCYRSQGVTPQDYLTSSELYNLMTRLNGADFDDDIHNQLWEQCKLNSKGQAKIADYITILMKAQKILSENQKQAITAIINLQSKIANQKLREGDLSYSRIATQQLQVKLAQLKETKVGYQADLQILRHPFTRDFTKAGIHTHKSQLQRQLQFPKDFEQSYPQQEQASQLNMSLLFYIAIVLILLEVPLILYFPRFHNLIFFLFIFCMYLFKHLNRRILNFLFYTGVITILIDIIWFIVIAGQLWTVPDISNHPKSIAGYFKFCVFLTALILIGKVVIIIILFQGRNYGELQVIHGKIFNKKILFGSHYTQTNPIIQVFPNEKH